MQPGRTAMVTATVLTRMAPGLMPITAVPDPIGATLTTGPTGNAGDLSAGPSIIIDRSGRRVRPGAQAVRS
jgi:hypothetical protein